MHRVRLTSEARSRQWAEIYQAGKHQTFPIGQLLAKELTREGAEHCIMGDWQPEQATDSNHWAARSGQTAMKIPVSGFLYPKSMR